MSWKVGGKGRPCMKRSESCIHSSNYVQQFGSHLLPWLATTNQPVRGGRDTSPINSCKDKCHCKVPAEPAEQGADATNQYADPQPASLTTESNHKPILQFPQHTFGKQQKAFCASCFCKYICIRGCTTKKQMILLFSGREALPRKSCSST